MLNIYYSQILYLIKLEEIHYIQLCSVIIIVILNRKTSIIKYITVWYYIFINYQVLYHVFSSPIKAILQSYGSYSQILLIRL